MGRHASTAWRSISRRQNLQALRPRQGRLGRWSPSRPLRPSWRGAVLRFPVAGSTPRASPSAADRIYVSSEGEAKVGLAPFVYEFDLEGRFVRELPLPDRYRPWPALGAASGVRDNLGFEALALSPTGVTSSLAPRTVSRRRARRRHRASRASAGCCAGISSAADPWTSFCIASRASAGRRRRRRMSRSTASSKLIALDRDRPAHPRTPVGARRRDRDEALRGERWPARRTSPASIRRRAWRSRRRRRPWCSTSPISGCRSTTSKAWRSARKRPTAGARWYW